MVELVDGSVIAQLGVTDMRLPIQHAFSYPSGGMRPARDSTSSGLAGWTSCRRIWIDSLAWGWPPAALADGRALPVVLNAANEVAVAAFLERRLRFTGIAEVIERAMDEFERASPDAEIARPNPSSGSSGARPGLGIGKIGIVTNLWAFLFVLGVLIFVHELGHFLMARRLGVRVHLLARLRPEAAQVHARRHGLRDQRDSARRLRQDGRRESGRSTLRPAR